MPELARIWTHLQRRDVRPRPEGFDVNAVVHAVQQVPGVREARLRRNPGGGHNLRLELADGADPAQVSRTVAQLLQEQMGLSASPREAASDLPEPSIPGSPAGGREPPRQRRRQIRGRPGGAALGRAQVEPARTATDGASQIGQKPQYPAPVRYAAGQAPSPNASADLMHEAREQAAGRLIPGKPPGPRVIIDQIQVSTFAVDATVEVRLIAGAQRAAGVSSGPAIDGYLLRLAADAAVKAINQLLRAEVGVSEPRGQCYLEHASLVPTGSCDIAIVVVYLACGGWVEQLSGSAVVADDPRQAVVRAVLAAMNRRLEALLS